jgi:colicin import membrane protein
MRAGLTVSVIAHLGLLAWGIVSLPMPSPVDASQLEMIPVDFVEIDDVTQLNRGLQTAALVEELPPPAPAEPEPPPLPAPPPPPQPEPPPPPEPEPPPLPTPPPPASVPEPAPTPEPPPPEPAPPPPAPSPEVAPPPPEEVSQPLTNAPMPRLRPQRTQVAETPREEPPAPEEDSFDIDQLTAMLDQPETETPPPIAEQQPTVGAPTSSLSNVQMTANELDLLRSRLAECWNVPIGWIDPAEVRVVLLLALNPDGSVAGAQVLEAPQGQFARQAPESAVRAVRLCAPYNLPQEKYDAWREVKVTFDPRDMGRT